MELVVLGAGPSYSNIPGAVGAAYLVRSGEDALLLDLGHGAFASLAVEVEPSTLLATAISHLHPDHYIDLVALRHYLRHAADSVRRARVIGPADLANRLDALHAEPGWTAASLDVEPTGGAGQRTLGPFLLEAALVTHTDESYAYRVSTGGTGLVYSGDCGRAEDLRALLRPGDVLLSEASFGPEPVPAGAWHLGSREAGRVAREADVSAVLLTHVLSRFDREETVRVAREEYRGRVDLVAPGDRFPL